MTKKKNPMKALYARLNEAGLKRKYVRKNILPSWWDDEIARNPVGYLEGLGYIAKHTGLALDDLRDEEAALTPGRAAAVRFKLRADVDEGDVTWAKNVALRLAEMAAYATETPYKWPCEPTALCIRQHILDAGHPWVSFEALLDFCWMAGVPVLHASKFSGKKPDGMAVGTQERHAVVLAKNEKQPAWLLFILAHELGHIVWGHVGQKEAWFDARYDPEATKEHEIEANTFAKELMLGRPDLQFTPGDSFPNGRQLADAAKRLGEECQIDPGAIALNFVYHLDGNYWGLARKALKEISPEADACSTVRERLLQHLDWSALPEESAEFVARLTGVELDAEHFLA